MSNITSAAAAACEDDDDDDAKSAMNWRRRTYHRKSIVGSQINIYTFFDE